MAITKTQNAFTSLEQAMAAIHAAGYHPAMLDVPAETNATHWHNFASIIFVLDGTNVITDAATGATITCGPGSRLDLARGALHHENHQGYRALFGFSIDPADIQAPVNLPPDDNPA